MPRNLKLETFDRFVDWFLHPSMVDDKSTRKQARLFLLSHILGPFLGNGVALVLLLADPAPGFEIGVMFLAISGFWAFPFLLRCCGRLELLALISIQNLTFAVLWTTYFYGGATSPFLAWMITIPLLAFFYVGDSRSMRLAIVVLLAVNAAGFYALYHLFEAPAHGLSAVAMQRLGLLSTAAIAAYVTMMALYYAKALASQAELETVMRSHKATASALKQAALQSERASAAKVEFVAKMSHELRTPLNAIIGYSQMLLEEAEGCEEDEDFVDLQRIQSAGQHLLKLVNQILELAKIDAGRMEVFNETLSIAEIVEDLARDLRAGAAERGNLLTVSLDPEIGAITGDRMKIESALSQILHNAIKYTENGTITVTGARVTGLHGEAFRITVEDTGIGIAAEHLPSLFEQFAVNDEQTATKYGGTGLGLALARKLCRLMQGDIAVETELGRGSRFILTFPAKPPAGAVATPSVLSALPGPTQDLGYPQAVAA
ncbi:MULTISPECIES: sensor histidine kinase [Methylobacterium]|uniref:histidine kinase n=1 Tax=Methylobacterium thuringiense TaxID=1003091 RepID=A0ABQ4TTJ0_9HYPH|nr:MULTISPECIES: HAMP domain-containing sensor histidine kinase [Methylobacterium]TXN23475.1 HAMP domain-containing histidine kinase [Methylobacterium sp. WL9]GJE57210.1 Sensor histidine kinase RcsC [Methylobacterium thuringiense]